MRSVRLVCVLLATVVHQVNRLVVLLLLVSAGPNVLSVHCTAPSMGDSGTCTQPILIPLHDPVLVHFSWRGPVNGSTWIKRRPGQVAALFRVVPPGPYRVTAWASNAIGRSCRDTTIKVLVTGNGVPIPRHWR